MNENDRVAEIAGRVAAATEGPWQAIDLRPQHDCIWVDRVGPGSRTVAELSGEGLEVIWSVADADFIAHSRSDVEYLLGRLRTAEAELATVKQERSDNLQAIAERDAVIAEAPHGILCRGYRAGKVLHDPAACDCWKSNYRTGADHE